MFNHRIEYNKLMLRLLLTFLFLTGCSVIHVKDRSQPTIKRNSDTLFSARTLDGEMRRRIIVLPFLNISSYPNEQVAEDARAYFLSQVEKVDGAVIIEPAAAGIDNLEPFKSGACLS